MRLLGRLRIRIHGREVVVLAVELRLRLGPELFHGQDRLAHLAPAMVEVAAMELYLLAQSAGSDAEEEPPAAEEIEAGDLLGQNKGVPLRHEDDARAELDAARHAGGTRESHEGVDEVPIALGNDAVRRSRESALRVHGNEGMLGAPEGLEA